jgi:hypothetical protein
MSDILIAYAMTMVLCSPPGPEEKVRNDVNLGNGTSACNGNDNGEINTMLPAILIGLPDASDPLHTWRLAY